MQITRLEIVNVLGIARAEINTPNPVTIIAGHNGSGKSSIADAISMAFTGQPRRVNLKKNLDQIVHDGAPTGRVSIQYDSGTGEGGSTAELRIPKGEQSSDDVEGSAFLPYVVDPTLFASLDSDARRTMLFSLTGCKTSGKVVVKKLHETYGIPMDVIEGFAVNLKGGFVSGAKAAGELARDAKAVWKSITGEQWGSEKAPAWKAATPASAKPTDADMKARLDAHQKIQSDIENGKAYISSETALQSAYLSYAERLKTAQDVAELIDRRRTKLDTTETDLAGWRSKLPDLESKLAEVRAGVVPLVCPCCSNELRMVAGLLEEFKGLKADTKASSDAALDVTKAKQAIQTLEGVRTNDLRDIAASEAAIEQVAAIKAEKIEVVNAEKLEKAREALATITAQEKTLRAEFNALQDLKIAHDSLALTEKKAADAHGTVATYLKIQEALSPEGIPASLLADAMAPVNQSLNVLRGMCGWSEVKIEADMAITYGGRLYGLCSESEQWRANALIALSIAQISQLKMVVLDRFDMLDLPTRNALPGFLSKLGDLGAMESIFLIGTMKAAPKLPKSITVIWVENNLAENPA